MKFFMFLLFIFIFDVNADQRFSFGAYSHFNEKKEHTDNPYLIAYDFHEKNKYYGISFFNNSFDQKTKYIYRGRKYSTLKKNFHYEINYGLIHGYKGEYYDRIPINTKNGYGIGFIPSIHYEDSSKKTSYGIHLFGSAGILLTFSIKN